MDSISQKLRMAHDAGYRIEWDALDSWRKVYWYHRPNGECILVGGRKTMDKDSVILAMWKDYQKSLEVNSTTDCRSEEGITVGLIDSIITMARVLAGRDLSSPAIQEALKDLRQDEDLERLLNSSHVKG